VLCVVLVRGLCSCGGVRFDVLCINCYSFLNDIAVLLLLLKKVYIILVLTNFRDVGRFFPWPTDSLHWPVGFAMEAILFFCFSKLYTN
jgi:hypothetical protein